MDRARREAGRAAAHDKARGRENVPAARRASATACLLPVLPKILNLSVVLGS
jgi:hypothetical protein